MKFGFYAQALLAALVLISSGSLNAAPILYETTLNLETPVLNPDGIDKIVFTWSTNETSGSVTAAELVDLTLKLFVGGSSIYSDAALINGVPQPIGGLSRTTTDLFWDFEIGTDTLHQARNLLLSDLSSTFGVQYHIGDWVTFPLDGIVSLTRSNDGVLSGQFLETLESQNSTNQPEPTSLGLWALLGLTGAAYCCFRSRQTKHA